MKVPFTRQLKKFFGQTFLIGVVISLTVFAWLRLIFFEVPFSFAEDGLIMLKTILFGWFLIIVAKSAWLTLLAIGKKIEMRRRKNEVPKQPNAIFSIPAS
jgi:hypothetical protein